MVNSVPVACQKLADEVNRLQTLLNTLQKTVGGPGGLNKGIVQEMAAISIELRPLQQQLTQCLIANGVKQPMSATLNGIANFFTATSQGTRSGSKSVSIGLFFFENPDEMSVTSFPQVTTPPFSVLGQTVTTTMMASQTQIGRFDSSSGDMFQALVVDLVTQIVTGLLAGTTVDDSTVPILLTTGNTSPPDGNAAFSGEGSPMDAAGNIGLVGAGAFVRGRLTGHDCLLAITGVVSPHP